MHTYRTIEHTADIGVEVRAGTVSELFKGAAYAMLSLMVDVSGVCAGIKRGIELEAEDLDELMFVWLNELLFVMESERLVFSGFDVSVTGLRLAAVIHGEPLEEGRHSFNSEIKAATYHGLSIERTDDGGWKARVIFDV